MMVLRDLSLVVIWLVLLSAVALTPSATFAEGLRCLKCHKGKESLENFVAIKGITTAEDLRRLVREGPKAGLHRTSSEEDLQMAIRYLNLK